MQKGSECKALKKGNGGSFPRRESTACGTQCREIRNGNKYSNDPGRHNMQESRGNRAHTQGHKRSGKPFFIGLKCKGKVFHCGKPKGGGHHVEHGILGLIELAHGEGFYA